MSVGEQIILRCTHGQSLSGFSQSAYRQALKELSADAEEYSPCAQQIRQAQLAAAAGQKTGAVNATTVAVAATPSELKAIEHAQEHGSGPVPVGGQVITPGVVHANVSSAVSTLPDPVLAVLALMLATLVALAISFARRRLRARRDG
ncbi:MAG TPA: hypothetical protein VMI13_05050 [Solirubrobacteraceae bacterium]|nr:hypothetical protein [Solirubrobacteraceae bacterium]